MEAFDFCLHPESMVFVAFSDLMEAMEAFS